MLHLAHPVFVHFTVALLVTGGLVESVGILARRPAAERFGSVLVLAGTVSLLPTLVTGALAAKVLEVRGEAALVLAGHETRGWVLAGWFVALVFWKAWFRGALPGAQRTAYAVLLVVGVVLVLWNGLVGGELVYVHGVGVRVP